MKEVSLFFVLCSREVTECYVLDQEEIIKKIAFNIKVERMRKNLTQFQLAEMIDVHEKYIGKVESGKQNLTIKTLIKLANALDIKLSKLVDIE